MSCKGRRDDEQTGIYDYSNGEITRRRTVSWLRRLPRHFVGGTPSIWRKQLIALTKATFPHTSFNCLGNWDLIAGGPDTPSAFVGRVVMHWVYAFAYGLLLSVTALPFRSFFGATLIGGLGHVAYGTGACTLVHYETTKLWLCTVKGQSARVDHTGVSRE
ncbi:hypothetical protein EDD16DRAFT_1522142 [Pisolithus croceorrhizus]|nr:hypothetical protein EDD16DRAFT_1522142 [Pisolithus croceorrhizus]KAI6135721.1 hypothetical protein EV401DRAFT_1881825 [Pisolithus croceorrhizus]